MKKILFALLLILASSDSFAAWNLITSGSLGWNNTWSVDSTTCEKTFIGPITDYCTVTFRSGTSTNVWGVNTPVGTGTHRIEIKLNGTMWTKYVYKSDCIVQNDGDIYYAPDGLTCQQDKFDHATCSMVPYPLATAQECCSNQVKDGMEWIVDVGGACADLPGYCPAGQTLVKDPQFDVSYCVTWNDKTQAECQAGGGEFWNSETGKCGVIADIPTYNKPGESPDELTASNTTNSILSDMINSNARDTASIVNAINVNTDVSTRNTSSIVSAIANNQSAIVAAINSKDFSPNITVESPTVNVSAPAVTVDTSSTNAAITAASSQASNDAAAIRAKLDGIQAAIEANGPAGPGGTDAEVKAAVDGLKPGIDGSNAALDAIKDKLDQAPVISGAPGEYTTAIEGETASRFGTRFQAFTDALAAAPVFAAFDSVLSGPSGSGGAPSVTINAGSYGSFNFDFQPFASALSVFGKLLVAASLLVAARLILANK